LNVAVGLARLGRPTTLATWIGDDPDGALLRAHLDRSGVALLGGSDGAGRTSTATASLDQSGGATYVFDLAWELPVISSTARPLVIHTGSIGAILDPGGQAVLAAIQDNPAGALVTYDPNARPQIMGDPASAAGRVEALVRAADLVKVSDEDLAWLYPGQEPRDVARRWLGEGPGLVVVTRGGQGSLAVTARGDECEVPVAPATVVDTVGAGDSFMAGLIHGLWDLGLVGPQGKAALREIGTSAVRGVLELASRIAAVTVSRAGANPAWLEDLR
jgi:fructokinase